jgi:hypothetical protein
MKQFVRLWDKAAVIGAFQIDVDVTGYARPNVADMDGTMVFAFVDVDDGNWLGPTDVLAAVQSLQKERHSSKAGAAP